MEKECYRSLAEHLDQLPGGFVPSKTGADQRLLEKLFTPREAELATHLTLDQEEARVIAERAGIPLDEAEQRLREMARKGLILSVEPKDGPARYQAVPWVIGIYEFQVNNLTAELLQALADYSNTRRPQPRAPVTRQIRTVPIGQSIKPHLEALPYEQVDVLVEAQDAFAVAPCICRRRAKIEGRGCAAPEESCLMFGEFANYYVRTGRGRAVHWSEVKEILVKADAANLVLQPSNSQDIAFICCCCGCCCGVLGYLKRQPKPSKAVSSSFIATLEPETCQGCWTCLDRCQMHALNEDGDRVVLDPDRCIGCGLCVSTCPSEALSLVRRPGSETLQLPVDFGAALRAIGRNQAH